MSSISFVKFHGAGNDFILIDDRSGCFPKENSLLIQKMCHRQFGIGADGVILLTLDPPADFGMRIFNRDGFEAESCGNGLRCLIQFLNELGLFQKKYRIKTQDRIVEGWIDRKHPVIDMGKPTKLELDKETEAGLVHCVDTGVPHAVQFVLDVDRIDVSTIGAQLRKKLQANINFASLQKDGSIRVRTFERGVEGETLSCGTGAAAVACIALETQKRRGIVSIHFPGGVLNAWKIKENLFISGPAEKVFTGSYP